MAHQYSCRVLSGLAAWRCKNMVKQAQNPCCKLWFSIQKCQISPSDTGLLNRLVCPCTFTPQSSLWSSYVCWMYAFIVYSVGLYVMRWWFCVPGKWKDKCSDYTIKLLYNAIQCDTSPSVVLQEIQFVRLWGSTVNTIDIMQKNTHDSGQHTTDS